MSPQSTVGVDAIPGHEDQAREIMAALGYAADRTSWQIPAGVGFVEARQNLIERLNASASDWSEALRVLDIPDHPDYPRTTT